MPFAHTAERFARMNNAKILRCLEKIFLVYLFANPLLDIFNGFYYNVILGYGTYEIRHVASLGITPSLLVRLIFLAAFAAYLFLAREKKSLFALLPIGAAFLLSLLSEYLATGAVALFTDVQYIAKYVYNLLVLMVYARVLRVHWERGRRDMDERMEFLMNITAVVLSVSILIPALLGVGFTTYADRFGYRGSCGFFYAANDITAILALLMPLTLGLAMRDGCRRFSTLPLIACALSANTLLVIGSKTAFLACGAGFALLLAYTVIVSLKTRDGALWKGYLLSLAASAVLFALLMLFSGGKLWETITVSFGITGSLTQTEGMEVALFSGRLGKLRAITDEFRSGGALVWLFGLSRGSREFILEMDILEVLFYYGVFGCITMLWLYIRLAVQFFRSLWRRCDAVGFALFTALGLVFGYLFLAGHVLFTVTSGFYFSLIILYSRVHFASRKEDVLLWKTR